MYLYMCYWVIIGFFVQSHLSVFIMVNQVVILIYQIQRQPALCILVIVIENNFFL